MTEGNNIMDMWDRKFAPWMVEESYKYYLASCHLSEVNGLGYISNVNAALAIEILFKSYLCKQEEHKNGSIITSYNSASLDVQFKDNEYKDTRFESVGEDRSKNRAPTVHHDLYALAKSLPIDIQSILFEEFDFYILKRRRHTFTNSRYLYELKNQSDHSNILSELVDSYINKTIRLYQKHKCDDVWISNFKVKKQYVF